MQLPKIYDPQQVENKWYQHWKEQGYFHPPADGEGEPFTIVMPPPNVTGSLHLGHALDNTLQDVLIRWRRMQGRLALWIPGTDHAGIATQARVEEQLAREGLSRDQLGREGFLERVWQWKEEYGGRIIQQLQLLGTSCDWDRLRFTMDEGCSKAVREVFVRLYQRGLIYRGDYIINWCPQCHTTISDIEVEHKELPGRLYHLRYPLVDSGEGLVVATTRPETMLGDTAVAVHPEDERYRHLVGKMIRLPLVGREIPVIADAHVDPAFGTGVVKVTPAHDPNDFEIGLRHDLPHVVVIGKNGKMTAEAGRYAGMDRYQCRAQLVGDLETEGILQQVEEHQHAVGHCYRCDTVIEPLVSRQWFVRMQPLAQPAIKAVQDGQIRFIPERFTKIYLQWLEQIRDWCISRQLWWGHRIPVWYCQQCGAEICQDHEPGICAKCSAADLIQDPDVLDTWFSSALWPFSTLGWPEATQELERFYPTSVLVTGRDIIFFWVARMIFMGLEFMEAEPFREVLIHGLVLDAEGRKMSKSLGNGIDPLEVIAQYGADPLRFMMVTGNAPGNDLRFQQQRLEGARNFANKIWNAARFSLQHLEGEVMNLPARLELEDRWILSRLNATIDKVTANLAAYELGEAAKLLYDFIWSELCDWYLELVKQRLYGNCANQDAARYTLAYTMARTMELLHPFMPFITEEIWQQLPHIGESIMLASWPQHQPELDHPEAEREIELIMQVIGAVRNIRAEMRVPPGQAAELLIVVQDEANQLVLEQGIRYLEQLARAGKVTFASQKQAPPPQSAMAVVAGVEIYLPLAGLIDLERERERLAKELQQVCQDLAKVQGKLSQAGFLAQAPADVVIKEQHKEQDLLVKLESLNRRKAFLD